MPFNSLSRDHEEVTDEAIKSVLETFNSLSRDHRKAAEELAKAKKDLELSTPSLGITRRGGFLPSLLSKAGTFNSLSRDHERHQRGGRYYDNRGPFNSLSRDHCEIHVS